MVTYIEHLQHVELLASLHPLAWHTRDNVDKLWNEISWSWRWKLTFQCCAEAFNASQFAAPFNYRLFIHFGCEVLYNTVALALDIGGKLIRWRELHEALDYACFDRIELKPLSFNTNKQWKRKHNIAFLQSSNLMQHSRYLNVQRTNVRAQTKMWTPRFGAASMNNYILIIVETNIDYQTVNVF